jgi:hypothetical protein
MAKPKKKTNITAYMVTTWLVVTSVVNIYASSVINPLIKNPKIYSVITSRKFYHHNYFLCNSFIGIGPLACTRPGAI